MDSHELTPEPASRMAVTAVTADIEFLLRTHGRMPPGRDGLFLLVDADVSALAN
jgi:hypothetical protein